MTAWSGVAAPASRVATEMPKATARRVRLVILDVDGVMTDGGLYIGAAPDGGGSVELKRFHVEDGIGIRMMKRAGLHVAIVSGRVSPATDIRAAELGISDAYQDPDTRKMGWVRKILEARGVDWPETALLGDDLADLPVLRKVGLPATVANGVPEVRRVAVWHGARRGGEGAVREFAEALLKARGQWDELVDQYCRERDS